ncbi:uncharacterized protein ColSpa_12446 [Colletotrichum spaethianum]|uniref:Uncharacterized protein n=1 Tax=Colletotrichum spaethianum TaxID=700344 RepID=A0AA37PH67_9PEZI|nr:uncharacterized protein ColSpa_12446 [Colletotrichum spaethianum]GKT52265.1 hypothetical protein ColSpa_12446 [Colletotrichum spaethianum]
MSVIGEGESPTNAKNAAVTAAWRGSKVPGVSKRSDGLVALDSSVSMDDWVIGVVPEDELSSFPKWEPCERRQSHCDSG